MNFCKVILILSVAVSGSYGIELPNFFSQCSLSDPNLGNCIKNSGNAGIDSLVKGQSKIQAVKLSPLHVDQMYIDVNGGLQINLTNFDIYGIETAKLVHVKWDPKSRQVEAEIQHHYTSLIGHYDVNGRIIILPINGNGACNITYVRPKFRFSFDFELEVRKNKEYIKIVKPAITYDTERAYFDLDNLFNGNENLAAPMRAFLDEHWREVNQEVGAKVGDALALVFGSILQNMFYRIPYSDLFSP